MVGDTHGCGKTVEKLIKQIGFDSEKDHVYFLGDYYGASDGDDHINLLLYLNQYYEPDLSKPGFHLLRGNHEWGNKYTVFLRDVWENIKISKLPDVVVLNVNGKQYVLSHAGMHKDVWTVIKNDTIKLPKEYQLDTDWRNGLNLGRKYYEAIVFTTKNGEINYYDKSSSECAEYWPKFKNDANVYFIHGHFPLTKDNIEDNDKYNYNYKKKDYIRYNELRHAINIDAGAKKIDCEERKLMCICLEELPEENLKNNNIPKPEDISNSKLSDLSNEKKGGVYFVKYEQGSAKIEKYPKYLDFSYSLRNLKLNNNNKVEIYDSKECFFNKNYNEKMECICEYIKKSPLKNKEVFINAMYILATITLENGKVKVNNNNCSKEEEEGTVEKAVSTIQDFVNKNFSANEMIQKMFGFKGSNGSDGKGAFEIPKGGTKEYYFFLADMKIKSCSYLLRIYNFLNNGIDDLKIANQRRDFIRDAQNTDTSIKEEDLDYYLFDNSMKEIDFVGISWKWLWRYEQGTSDLFRCVGTDEFTYEGNINLDGSIENCRKYYQTMIKNIVSHMNKGDHCKSKLASFSKNPYRDIYKYMSVKYENNVEYYFKVKKNENNEFIAELKYKNPINNSNDTKKEELCSLFENTNKVTFAMIKQAKTNIIRKIEEGWC